MSIREDIDNALKAFNHNPLYDSSINLFNILGYNTRRQNELYPNTFEGFSNNFLTEYECFNKDGALSCEWKKVELLFQLTEEEIKFQDTIYSKKVYYKDTGDVNDNMIYYSYLFFAIELSGEHYTRGQLSQITREINKVFPMPVMILFKYNGLITLSIIDRRLNKRDKYKDVLQKVTLIKDISIEHPNRAHIQILTSLHFDGLKVSSFNELHDAWRRILNISELNKRFYREITTWFYKAINIISLPVKPEYTKDANEVKKNFLVRLISRMLFCWFLKEKGLIDKELLELADYNNRRYNILKDIDCTDDTAFFKSNSYYRGILQNIFFKSLNQENKSSKDDFAWRRYLPQDFDYNRFLKIPYINGGTFDAYIEDNAGEELSDDDLCIPNSLFYGDVGLNNILFNYKFTIEENTPLEEDIALDPELLGLVFENLLAELDPNADAEVVKSIRRQTGAYYTPRKVIDYMVSEALNAYLDKYFKEKYSHQHNFSIQIYNLVYQNKVDTSDRQFCQTVVDALDKVRILDPACGSGSFPMGMLQKMVQMLKLVDFDNGLWMEKQVESADPIFKDALKSTLKANVDDYRRKLGIIRNCIYGIDIQPLAVQITKLRFFISLLIEQRVDRKAGNLGIQPMPNLETKLICANSLRDIKPNLMNNNPVKDLIRLRERYYQHNISYTEKNHISYQIARILYNVFPGFTKEVVDKQHKENENINIIKEWFMHGAFASPFFNTQCFFSEIAAEKGFDIIIGNPPYGGVKISDEIQRDMGLGSKDIYGAFISRFLCSEDSPLKSGGILAYIVSDTFMTIKTHKQLRQQMMENVIHKMIRTHSDTFSATVNAAIIICERREPNGRLKDNICQMVDMTNISIHKDYEKYIDVLNMTIEYGEKKCVSNREYAIYHYPQSLIRTNSNLPFFVASPKLFALVQDCGDVKKEWVDFEGKKLQVRKVVMNDREIRLVKLEQIAEVKQGLATGDNHAYLFQEPGVRGSYRNIEEYKGFILTEDDLDMIRNNEKLRALIIEKGISVDNKKSIRYFGGRYIIPYDKGGESNADEGWLPNYYVPTNYYIDWSEWAVKRLRTLTTKERNRLYVKNGGDNRLCSRFQNADTYFKDNITFSWAGVYSPTFRIGCLGLYDHGSSSVFVNYIDTNLVLSHLASKLQKYLMRNYINHSVNFGIDNVKEIGICIDLVNSKSLTNQVVNIIANQKKDKFYNYFLNEQMVIDSMLNTMYGLNKEDIDEVEDWYSRRYPSIANKGCQE